MKQIQYILIAFLCVPLFAQQTYVPDNNFEAYLEANGMGNGIANDDSVTTANIDIVTHLYIQSQNISDLTGIGDFLALTHLTCFLNSITSLDLSNNTALIYLNCYVNLITSLNLSNNTALIYLNCFDNSITSLNLSANTALTLLDCHNNQLTSLDLRNGNNTMITYLNSTVNPNLTCIDVDDETWSNANWTAIDSWTSFSEDCSAGDGGQTYVPDDNFEAYLEANGMGNGIANDDSVTTANINTVNYLYIGNQGISDLTGIQDFSALYWLYCNNNNLLAIDLSANSYLYSLDCSYNQLSTLSLTGNDSLEQLNCGNNQISNLDVSANIILRDLWAPANSLSNINLNNNIALINLGLGNNQLDTLNLDNNPSLEHLNIVNNQVSTLNLIFNVSLTDIWISNNNIAVLDVHNSPNLTIIWGDNNQIVTLDLSNNANLVQLYVPWNQLAFLDVANGNNTIMTVFHSTSNLDLNCIDVDDETWSNANWTAIDSWTSFSEDCSALPVSDEPILVTEYKLHDAYPNPFNPITTLRYDLPEQANVNIIIYDMLGRQVRTLLNEIQDAGYRSVIWNATNDFGKPVSAGVYLYQIQAGEFVKTKKMVLLK